MSERTSVYLPLPQAIIDWESEEELLSDVKHLDASNANSVQMKHKHLDEGRDAITALSPARKTAFVLSLFVCLGTVVVFMLLPCDLKPCGVTASSWETPILDFELHGPVAVVRRAVGSGSNLVLLARSALAPPHTLKHRLICLYGVSGAVLWTHMLMHEPLDLDCTLLDVNRDGVLDCLLAGSEDLLKAVDPLSGVSVWDMSWDISRPRAMRTLLPVLLPDLNEDGVPELLTVRCFHTAPHSILLLLSGASGKVIGSPVPLLPCVAVNGLLLEKDLSLSYTCLDAHSKKSEQTVPLSELVERAELPKLSIASWLGGGEEPGEPNLEAHVAGWRLLLENQGRCPADCRALLLLKDQDNRTLYNRTLDSVFGMTPKSISFGRLTGFVVKLWQWRPGKKGSPVTAESVVNLNERVVLMTISDRVHVVNVSEQSVVQVCRAAVCQPSAAAARRSLLITDLDGDGSKELVSYSSSYTSTETQKDKSDSRRLHAHVRVVRLETDLPQLYQK